MDIRDDDSITDGVDEKYLRELEEENYQQTQAELHAEYDRTIDDIKLIERALADALCRRDEIQKQLRPW